MRVVFLAIGIPVLVLAVAAVLLVAFLGSLPSADGNTSTNSAHRTVVPILRSISSVGGKEICYNGDGGHSGLNNEPWYSAYYSIPDEPSARAVVLKAAAAIGYPLSRRLLFPGDADPYGLASNPSSDDYGLTLSIYQHQVFSPGDCSAAAGEKIRLSGSEAVFEIIFYGKPNK